MTEEKRAVSAEEPLIWETVKPQIRVRILRERLSNARYLLEGISSVGPIHEQICGIEKSIKACYFVFENYSSRRIDYETFKADLCSQLTPVLLDELKFLGCGDVDQPVETAEMLKCGTALEGRANNLGLQGDFGRIVERLIAPMRQDGFGFQGELEYLNLPDFGRLLLDV